MKFVIEKISKSSGRLGLLIQTEGNKRYQTPMLVQTTKGGSIPYLSREVFEYITKKSTIFQLTLSTIDHMADSVKLFKGSIEAYVGFPDCLSLLMIRDPCEIMPSGHNDKDIVPLFTKRGKQSISANRYMDMVEIFKPDIYQGVCDADTNIESSKKRLAKCVDRTSKFMDICYERHKNSNVLSKSTLFVPIVGGYSTFARSDSIKHAKAKDDNFVGGYIFEGFHNYGISATKVDSDQLKTIMTHCLKELSVDKLIMMPGAYTPPVILELIAMGVDMFDTSYACCAAADHKALTFNFDLKQTENVLTEPFLDTSNEKFKNEFTSLVPDCSCLACKQHTRAYLHHLYKTRELLGPILLMIHNLHHFMQFFNTICTCITEDKLNELIQLIKLQGHESAVDYIIKSNSVANKLHKGMSSSDTR